MPTGERCRQGKDADRGKMPTGERCRQGKDADRGNTDLLEEEPFRVPLCSTQIDTKRPEPAFVVRDLRLPF